jgi:hypothetical protein
MLRLKGAGKCIKASASSPFLKKGTQKLFLAAFSASSFVGITQHVEAT